MTRRLALGLEYAGDTFHGFQRQAFGATVQAVFEDAVAQIAGHPVVPAVAGRTDAGVHATGQVVHIDVQVDRPMTAWVRGVNRFLPSTVAVTWVRDVPPDFHARFSATGRRYSYFLLNRTVRPAALAGRVGWDHRDMDERLMAEAASYLPGWHDFSAFRAAQCQAKSPVKLMYGASVCRQGELLRFDFHANAFLHHMVRNLVGALAHVGQGKKPPAWIKELLSHGDRSLGAPTFMPDGLYLTGIDYDLRFGLPSPAPFDLPILT